MRDEIVQWFAEKGITNETLEQFGISEVEGGKVAFPYPGYSKLRGGIPNGERSFVLPKGQQLHLFNESEAGRDLIFLVEGETDTMRLRQELTKTTVGVLGLPGIESWRDEWVSLFDRSRKVYVVLDNDSDYNVRARVDSCWTSIRKSLGPKARRVYLPDDTKDICDFFKTYDLETLKLLTDKPKWHFARLDFTKPPEPYDWLVKDFICKGDVTLLVGEPNVGKSFVSMSLAVAVATGATHWLGMPVSSHGNVLYIDEENPEDVVRHRMARLGLPNDCALMHYVHRGGVRLDRNIDLLLDEALALQPQLIVLDSFVRLHTQAENESGAVSELFNDAIAPLARDTGATVLLLHHTGKTDSSSSFNRVRGSSDISAAVDTAFDLRPTGVGRFNLVHFKSRRSQANSVIPLAITDTSDTSVSIEVTEDDGVF